MLSTHDQNDRQASLSILVLTDGNAGHEHQSMGFVDLLAESRTVSVRKITVEENFPGILRQPISWLVNQRFGMICDRLLTTRYRIDEQPEDQPGLIVSSGGKTAMMNVLLARRFRCPNLFLGELDERTQNNVTAVADVGWPRAHHGFVGLELLLSQVTPRVLKTAALEYKPNYESDHQKRWCMLIGGNSRSHRYEADEWRRLAEGMNRLAEQSQARWLVTTSPRTGAVAESILAETLQESHLEDLVLYGRTPKAVVRSFLGCAELTFVTQDSLTMLCEAVASRNPVYVLCPKIAELPPIEENRSTQCIEHLIENRYASRIPIADFRDFSLPTDFNGCFRKLRNDYEASMLRILVEKLGLDLSEQQNAAQSRIA